VIRKPNVLTSDPYSDSIFEGENEMKKSTKKKKKKKVKKVNTKSNEDEEEK